VNNLREKIQLEKELENLRTEVEKKYDYNKSILGNSEAIKKVFRLIEKATRTNITVSISGETGTGKELVAKAIHFNSDRSKKKFVPINVTAIPKDLIESELFGHEKGAFTGATARRIGKFEEAAGGTLFLDEIAEMDINMQTKLLRALQEREIVRVGSNHPVKIDVRIIVATHKDLKHEVKEGRFREDLYYRLLGLPIYLPPLRERDHDILILAKSFLENFVKDNNLHPQKLSNPVQKRLLRYSFPGNVRELKAMVELAAVMTDNETIEEEDINIPDDKSEGVSIEKEMTLKEYELQILQLYLQKYDNNVLKVAKILDIGKSTLYRMIKNEKLNKE
jgi:DNA-binding NtrC family response regulator